MGGRHVPRGLVWPAMAALALVAVVAAVPWGGSIRRSIPSSPSAQVSARFCVAPRVSAQPQTDGLLVLANTPWTVTVTWTGPDGSAHTRIVAGDTTGEYGRLVTTAGPLLTFTLVTGR